MTTYRLTATERRDRNNVMVEEFSDHIAALDAALEATADGFAVRLETLAETVN